MILRRSLVCVTLVFFALTAGAAAQHEHAAGAAGTMTDAQLIKSAMMAAPAPIAKNATIIAVAPDGAMRTIRKGTNNFTCMADNPNTPGPDPMCADQKAMEWVQAWIGKKEPPKAVGFMYMLAGGTDASNTDPYAQKPEPANNWVKTGAHVMIVGATGMLDNYPRAPKPNTAEPYVMWAGTPYEHLMIPVK
jgi:hypothetical protein